MIEPYRSKLIDKDSARPSLSVVVDNRAPKMPLPDWPARKRLSIQAAGLVVLVCMVVVIAAVAIAPLFEGGK